ncbi:MAG: hypothetical protein LCI00_14060 [Chloroflexi bacterium]|nr:hypothetical protein [Chloroflexota bacterium]MCC6892210.1 hypothetical protein [Anaerolineae bacterium]
MMSDDEHDYQQKKNAEEAKEENSEWNTWVVASGSELKEAFGLTAENRPTINLNPENIPDRLRMLIPYAEVWGITDDLIRADVIDKASPEALQDLILTIGKYQDAVNEWLAGSEAYQDKQIQEYYVFSALLMAFDEARPYP